MALLLLDAVADVALTVRVMNSVTVADAIIAGYVVVDVEVVQKQLSGRWRAEQVYMTAFPLCTRCGIRWSSPRSLSLAVDETGHFKRAQAVPIDAKQPW